MKNVLVLQLIATLFLLKHIYEIYRKSSLKLHLDKSIFTHYRNITYLLTEIYKVKLGLFLPFMSDIFSLSENSLFNLRSSVTVNGQNTGTSNFYGMLFKPKIEICFHDEWSRFYYEWSRFYYKRSRFSWWTVKIFMMNGWDFHVQQSTFSC